MPTRNLILTDHLDSFIEAGVSSGRFTDASEVMREALRLLEQREKEDQASLEWLRAAAAEGFGELDRGESIALHTKEELKDLLNDLHHEAVAAFNSNHD